MKIGNFPNTAENYWLTKDGDRRLISWSNTVLVGLDKSVTYIIGTGIDITEHRKMETALQDSERKYRELVENANSIILRWDNNGIITFFNEFAQKFFGYEEDEILGKNVVGTIVPERDSSGRDLRAMIQDIEQVHFHVAHLYSFRCKRFNSAEIVCKSNSGRDHHQLFRFRVVQQFKAEFGQGVK